jgi:hypothetical protein
MVLLTLMFTLIHKFTVHSFRMMLGIAVLILSCNSAIAQSTADPAYANMQRAMGGILQQRAQSMGYSITDPRTYGTLYGVGKTATSMATGAGSALLIGTAPAWATVLGVNLLAVALATGVSYAVYVGIDHLVNWAFSPSNSSSPISTSATAAISAPAGTFFSPSASSAYITGTPLLGLACFSNIPPCAPSYTTCYGSVAEAQATFAAINTYMAASNLSGWPQCRSGNITSLASANYFASIAGGTTFSVPSGIATTAALNQTLSQAISALTSSQLSQPVDTALLATLVNNLWQKSASQSTYTGIPYDATRPITSTEVQNWQQANSSAYPTVAALVAPVTDTATGFAPSATSSGSLSPATSTSPSTTTTTTTATAGNTTTTTSTTSGTPQPVTVTNKVSVDLGIDPAVASPTLESTPTASAILAPILNLFPSFKNFAVPSHTADCPKPSFDAFGKHFVMDTHCDLFEQQRSTLYSTMLLAFMLVAIFIVLSA